MIKPSKTLCVLLIAVLFCAAFCDTACIAEEYDGYDSANLIKPNGTTQVELAIAYARSQTGSSKYSTYCQRFVRVCFEAAGITASTGVSSAKEACDKWLVSTSRDNIPVGAVLYFDTGVYGHSAIYLGNNRMIHALSRVTEQEISNSFWDLYIGWGWQAGIQPTGAYINQADVLNGDVYRTAERVLLYDAPDGNVISTIPEGSALSVTYTASHQGEQWGKASYYSQEGYIRLKYCEYLYTAGGDTETKSLADEGVIAAYVSSVPSKYYYAEGEDINTDGLEITLVRIDGSMSVTDSGYEVITSKAFGTGKETALIRYCGALMWFHIIVSDVNDDLAAFKLRSDKATRIDDLGCLVVYDEIKVSRISSLLKNSGYMTVYSAEGEQKHSGYLATGDYVVYNGASYTSAITVVRYGDVNGDGNVSIADTLCKKRYLLGLYELDETIAKLADKDIFTALQDDIDTVVKYPKLPYSYTQNMPY